jgi:hypothetical protein
VKSLPDLCSGCLHQTNSVIRCSSNMVILFITYDSFCCGKTDKSKRDRETGSTLSTNYPRSLSLKHCCPHDSTQSWWVPHVQPHCIHLVVCEHLVAVDKPPAPSHLAWQWEPWVPA